MRFCILFICLSCVLQVFADSFGFATWNIGHFAGGLSNRSSIAAARVDEMSARYRAFLARADVRVLGVCEHSRAFSADGSVGADKTVFADFDGRDLGLPCGWNENAVRSVVTNGASVVTNWTAGAVRLTPSVKDIFVKPLGIRADLVLRSDDECRGMTGSPIGKDVRWVRVPSGNYWEMTNETFKAAFANDFKVFLDRASYPIVFHCIAGADRTGSLACILNALLGVDEDELAKDWEATGFVNEHPKLRHDIRWDPLVRAFDGYPGATLNARIEAYVKDCGFSDGDIDRFRAIMLEGRR